MSLLSIDYYNLAISPNMLTLLHVSGGFRPEVLDKKSVSLSNGLDFDLLAQMLSKSKKRRKLNVVMSNQLFKYKLLALPVHQLSESEIQASLQFSFQETYGDVAAQWLIRYTELNAESGVLASALDGQLYENIKKTASQHQLKLNSLQPYLMAGFNQASQLIDAHFSCFIQIENASFILGFIENHQWKLLRNISFASSIPPETLVTQLNNQLSRELLLLGWDAKKTKLYLQAPSRVGQFLNQALQADWQLIRLNPATTAGLQGEKTSEDMMVASI